MRGMVWVIKNSSGANSADYSAGATDYVWVADEPSAAQPALYNAPQSPAPVGIALAGYEGVPAEEQHTPATLLASDPGPSAATGTTSAVATAGTSAADVFVLDRGTLAAATAVPPAPLQIHGLNAG